MRFLRVAFWLELKQKLFTRWFVILVLLMGALISAVGIFGAQQETPWNIRAGIAYSEGDEFAQGVAERLGQLTIAEFVPLTDYSEQELRDLVEQKQLGAVYLLRSDLGENIAKGRLSNSIHCYVTSKGGMNAMVDKWVVAAALIEASPLISTYELSKALNLPPEQVAPVLEESFRWFEENYSFVTTVSTWSIETVDMIDAPQNISLLRISHGVLSMLLIVFALVCINAQIASWRQIQETLNRRRRAQFTAASFVATWVGLLLLGSCGLAVLMLSGLFTTLRLECVALAAYCALLSAYSTLLAQLLHDGESIPSAGIFLLLMVLTLGGILLDPAEIGSGLVRLSRLFPTSYYADMILQQALPLLSVLLVASGIGLFLSLLLSLRTEQRR